MSVSPSPSSAAQIPIDNPQSPATVKSPHLLTPKERLLDILSAEDLTASSEYPIVSSWSAFEQLDDVTRQDVDLRIQLLVWMSHRLHKSAHNHVLDLFSHLHPTQRTAATYHAAVAASIKLGNIHKAADIHSEASMINLAGSIGSNLIMEHAIKRENWAVAKRVQDCFEYHIQNWSESLPLPKLWNRMRNVPNLDRKLNKLVNLYTHAKDSRSRKRFQKLIQPVWRVFVRLSIHNTLSNSKSRESIALAGTIRELCFTMFRANIDSVAIYEDCIIQLCSDNAKLSTTVTGPIIGFVYNTYRRSAFFRPSPQLLSHMVNHWRNHKLAFAGRSTNRYPINLEMIVKDWKHHNKSVDDKALEIIMDCFARLGNAKLVKLYADYYKSLHVDGLPDASRLWPLIYVHAENADSIQAAREFDRIKSDFGVDPDLKCWNVLLHAYEKSNDLQGTASVLEKLLMTTIQPDTYSFAPLLEMYGEQGDVEAVEHILELARDCGVDKPTTHMLNSKILSFVTSEDMQGAENALNDATKAVQSKHAEGSLTICFNTVLTAHALRRDLDAAMKIYQRMTREGIAFDANSYAALVQVLCFFRQTAAAHKLLTDVMPDNRLRPTAFHYAIIMAGYVLEGDYKRALKAEKEMEAAMIRPSVSSQIAVLKAKALLEQSQRKVEQGAEDTSFLSFEDTIRDFQKMLDLGDVLPVGSEPGFGIRKGSSRPALTADFLVFIHGKERAFEAVSRIMKIYQEKAGQDENAIQAPMHLLTSMMSVHLRAGQYAEVDRCWALAKSQAQEICSQRPILPKTSAPKSTKWKPAKQLPPGHRFLLSRPLRYYMASQFSQSSPATITAEISDLLSEGYALDNQTWNAYIVRLCRTSPPRALLAFSLVEKFMIAEWPGWITARTGVVSNTTIKPKASARAERLTYIKARYLRPGQLLPQYQTMVYLASALLELRSFEASGYGGIARGKNGEESKELKRQVGTLRAIREKAPRTLFAVQSMPRVYDRLQQRLIRRE